MKTLKDIIIAIEQNYTIKDVLQILNDTSKQIVLVTQNKKLVGTITDGDIRRALLKGKGLESSIEDVYFKTPAYAYSTYSKEERLEIMNKASVGKIPILNDAGEIVDLIQKDELTTVKIRDNTVVLMAGGLGSRLRPLTDNIPKPLLNIGPKPILETIIEKFIENGFRNFLISVNYKSKMIKEYFGNGSKYGNLVSIEYIEEEKRLGTAGALSLIEKKIDKPFFVMNGDILTNVNFESLLKFHENAHSKATMCVREFDFKIPYGVVEVEGDVIQSIVEKPVHTFFVNAGIYMLEPQVLSEIPKGEFFDMPSLFDKLMKEDKKTCSFPIFEYWMDIGHLKDYEQANIDYERFF